MKMSRAEKIEYVSSKQNDYTLSCDITVANSPAGQVEQVIPVYFA